MEMEGGGKAAVFTLRLERECRVMLAGTFNSWNPEQLRMRKGEGDECYRYTLELPPGIHEYCFVIDGCWLMDRENEKFVANEFGTMNSVVEVK